MEQETRSFQGKHNVEGNMLVGYAAVFNSPTKINERGKTFTETVKPGAFTRAIQESQDVICCVNHNQDRLLGRTSSGTLRLSEDAHGLRYEVDIPQSEAGIKELVARGDLFGSSFKFGVRKDTWKNDARELNDLDLFDVSLVVHAAYPTATVALRSSENWQQQINILRKLIPSD